MFLLAPQPAPAVRLPTYGIDSEYIRSSAE